MQCYPICKRPWDNVLIGIDGKVRFCCHASNGRKSVLGNLNDSSFEEIWNGQAARRIRRAFLNGEIPDECKACPVSGR